MNEYHIKTEGLTVPDPTAPGYVGTHSPTPSYSDDTTDAIRHIADATRQPLDLPGLPVVAEDGTFQRPVDVHFVYLRKREDSGKVTGKHDLWRRFMGWFNR